MNTEKVEICLSLHWDKLQQDTREEVLAGACLNQRFAHYSWAEMEEWIRTIIKDNISTRSKGTVEIDE